MKVANSEITEKTKQQLNEYFSLKRTQFKLPLKFVGTKFQKSVWQELNKIEFGKTISYLELSKRIGNEKSIRAVAAANGANAISIIVPCHRVIGSGGNLVGYAGGIPTKKHLLKIEGAEIEKQLNLFD